MVSAFCFCTDLFDLFTLLTSNICIPVINSEDIDFEMITTQDITFVMINGKGKQVY